MSKKQILTQLIADFLDFEESLPLNQDCTMSDFLGHMNAKQDSLHVPLRDLSGSEEVWLQDNRSTATELSVLFIFMYRYSVLYGKKALRGSEINTLDEFSFLIVLMTYVSLSKTELINKLIIEKTSGIEVIKRLLKQGMIAEKNNPHDKRSVLVAISEKGKQAVKDLLPKMQLVGEAVVGDLSKEEIGTLSYLLRKLDYFHNHNYTSRRDMELEELVASGRQQ